MKTLYGCLLAASLGLVSAGAANASTVNEADLGSFSGNYLSPTVIANGATTVNGVWDAGGDTDVVAFTGLKTGVQTMTLSFSPLSPIGDTDWSFSAGGTINYKTSPFQYSAWEGTTLANVSIQHWNRNNNFDYTITTGEDFAGQLYLSLVGTYGTLKYSVLAPGNELIPTSPPGGDFNYGAPLPAAVPLPAALPLLIAAIGAMGIAVRRRKTA